MDRRDLLQIGYVAEMFHISVGTLRHYEKCGLLKPEYIDEKTGYRYYSTKQFEVLNTIRALRVIDMPLRQIEDFLQNRDVSKMVKMLKKQKEIVIQKEKELKIIEDKINNRLKLIEDAVTSEIGIIKIRNIPSQRVAWLKNNLSLNSYLDLETSIRELEKNQSNTVVWLGKVGVGIAEEKLKNGDFSQYDIVFVLLDKEDVYTGKTEIWQAETCVTLRFCGSHKDAPKQYKRLMNYIKKNKMSICGFSREITMIDNGLTNDQEQFVTEIQIPIRIK